MVYVCSDLHGFPLVRFRNGLASAGFGEKDILYVIGDVIDRHGDGGAAMLRWMIEQRNVILLMGNHEMMMLSCADLLTDDSPDTVKKMEWAKLRSLLHWTDNGGGVTIEGLRALRKQEPDAIPRILRYVRNAPLYLTTRVCGRDFLLCHAGMENFAEDRPLADYSPGELLWNRPSLDDEYYDGVMTVFGHTPTILYGMEYAGKIIRTRTWCNIDVNTSAHDVVAVLRLDDMKEFYI